MTDSEPEPVPRRHAGGGGIESWLDANRRIVIAAIVAVSVVIRVIYFVEITHSPADAFHLAPQSDMHFFDLWAKSIAEGDYLTDKALHPLSPWQRQLAGAYFDQHPEVKEALVDSGEKNPPRAIWEKWYRGKRFHQEPLYPYLIAGTYMLFESGMHSVFLWQMLLGVLINVLIYLLARRFFSATVAAIAAILAVLCAPLLFYEMVLIRSTLITFVTLAMVLLADEALHRNSRTWWLAMGIMLGVAALVKMSLILVGLGVLVLFIIRHPRPLPRLLANGALIGAGMLLALTPLIARNRLVSVAPFEMSSVGAVVFACTNTADYSPDISEAFPCSLNHVPEIMGTTNGGFSATVLQTLGTHENVGSYLAQVWKKFLSVWTWYEKPNNVNFYFFQLHSKILRYLPVTFALLGSLSILGLALGATRFRSLALLYVTAGAVIAPMLIFYATARFRTALTALLIPFAAYALVRVIALLRARPLVGACLAAVIVIPPAMFFHTPDIRSVDHLIAYHSYYKPLIHLSQASGDYSRSDRLYREALRHEPSIGSARPPVNEDELQSANVFFHIHHDYADMLWRQGKKQEAARQDRCADDIKAGAMKYMH
jgi:hypothetical protein